MTVNIYSKDGCKICESAKEKLKIMGIRYTTHDLQEVLQGKEGWREDGSALILATYAFADAVPPVIEIDGQYYDYPGAMRKLKETNNG